MLFILFIYLHVWKIYLEIVNAPKECQGEMMAVQEEHNRGVDAKRKTNTKETREEGWRRENGRAGKEAEGGKDHGAHERRQED